MRPNWQWIILARQERPVCIAKWTSSRAHEQHVNTGLPWGNRVKTCNRQRLMRASLPQISNLEIICEHSVYWSEAPWIPQRLITSLNPDSSKFHQTPSKGHVRRNYGRDSSPEGGHIRYPLFSWGCVIHVFFKSMWTFTNWFLDFLQLSAL